MLLLAGYGLIALQLASPSMLRIAGRRCSRSSTSVFGGVVAAMAQWRHRERCWPSRLAKHINSHPHPYHHAYELRPFKVRLLAFLLSRSRCGWPFWVSSGAEFGHVGAARAAVGLGASVLGRILFAETHAQGSERRGIAAQAL